MEFVQIQSADILDLFAVRIATWDNDNGADELEALGITPDSVRRQLHTTHRGWLCRLDGKVVGFAIGNNQTGEMWVISVLKAYENRGIGRRLLTLVEGWLFAEGWKEIWLTTDPDENYRAVGFYRHCGWEDWKIENGERFMRKRKDSA